MIDLKHKYDASTVAVMRQALCGEFGVPVGIAASS
jgi:hypothetical protein